MTPIQLASALKSLAPELGKMIGELMDSKLGRNRTGYVLILATTGNRGSVSLKTNMRLESVTNILQETVNNLKGKEKNRIITI